METQADLITGRLGTGPVDGRPESAAIFNRATSSYRASRLGLSPQVQDPSESPRTKAHISRPNKLRAARRSARWGWTAAAMLVLGCGLASYFLTARIIRSFSFKLEGLTNHVRQQMAAITKLEEERDELRAGLASTHADLSTEQTEHAKTTTQLEASISRLVEAIRERDRARSTLGSEQAKAATITAQLEASVAKLVEAMKERDLFRATLGEEQEKTGKITVQLEASIAKLVDAMKERDRAREHAEKAVWEVSKAEAKLDLLEKRLRALTAEQERLKKVLDAPRPVSMETKVETLVLDLMISQFKADIDRFKEAVRQKEPPPAEAPAKSQ